MQRPDAGQSDFLLDKVYHNFEYLPPFVFRQAVKGDTNRVVQGSSTQKVNYRPRSIH